MTRITQLLLLLAALAPAFMAAPCFATGLRGEVLLQKDVITLGDIFGDVGDKTAATVIGAAPAPGQKVTYDVMALNQLATRYGIAWQPASNYEKVTLTRASQVVNAAMIKDRVAAEIGAITSEKDLDIALDNSSLEIHRALGDTLDWRLADLSYDPVRHRFAGSLIVEGAAGTQATVQPIAGRAMPMVKVAVLAKGLAAGSRFTEDAVDWQPTPIDRAGADALTDPSQLKGVEAKRMLDAKAILRLRDCTKARLITKGSLVTMQIMTPTMQISAQGRALSDAVMGETVRVMNTQSNRAIDAIVIGEGKVSVTPLITNHVASAQ